MKIEIKKVTLADFIDAADAREYSDGRDDLASATVSVDLAIDGQDINDVPVYIGGNHAYGGCSPSEAKLVVWLDDLDGEAPHLGLKAALDEIDEDKGDVEDALAADPRIIEIKERVWQKWEKV